MDGADSHPILRAKGVTKVYATGDVLVHALRGVDIDLARGELVTLLGASGSGKSTLLNILGGLDVPTSGTVEYSGHGLSEANERQLTRYRREHVGFVFQFYNLIPSLTARENVELVTDIADNPATAEESLALVGLSARLDHFPARVPGGDPPRGAPARPTAKRPDLLLCDEPTGALDFQTGVVVLEVLADVNKTLGTTTVLITHNAGIARMSDRVVRLADGRIVSDERNLERVDPRELSW
jgi:putative ABC transport system ATP-binding protein